MKKIYLIVFVSILTLLLGSCSGEEEETAEETPPPQPTEAAANTSAEAEAQESEFAEEEKEPPQEVSGLRPQIQAEQRRKGIIAGRSDPFAIIPVEPTIVENPDATGTSKIDSNDSELPPPPLDPDLEGEEVVEAELAKQVVVTGVIELGEVTQIIISAPNEPYTRYVQPGQYVSNGEVLVKRIENGSGATPIVVLEQSGIEVFKPVGYEAEQT